MSLNLKVKAVYHEKDWGRILSEVYKDIRVGRSGYWVGRVPGGWHLVNKREKSTRCLWRERQVQLCKALLTKGRGFDFIIFAIGSLEM